jgi:hypothetical protein
MLPEEIDKSREKETHERNSLRQAMSLEEIAKSREKATDGMRRFRQVMFSEETSNITEKETIARKRLRWAMSPEVKAKTRARATDGMRRFRQVMSSEETAKIREKETKSRKRLKVENNDAHCIKEAKKYLHRTQDSLNPHKHKSIVCVVCDRFIIGTETIHFLSKNNIIAHERRLSVESYERYYDTKLKPKMRSQYMINDGNLKHFVTVPMITEHFKGIYFMLLLFWWHATKHDKQKITSKI